MRWGRTVVGADHLALEADRAYLFDVGGELLAPLVVGSVIAHLDGLGPGSGEQRLRPVVMEAGDPSTLAVGDEVVIPEAQGAAWVHLTFDAPPTLRAGTEPRLGLFVGPASQLVRLSGALGNAGVSQRFASAYGAAPDVSGAAADMDLLASILAVGVEPWAPPGGLAEEDLAALPFAVGQAVFGIAGPLADPVAATCGWHYNPDDPPAPSTAIARTGGPLAELVGERLRITAQGDAGPLSVVVLLDDEQPFDDDLADEDLSLTRDAFKELAPLWTETLDVAVEVLA